MLRLAFVCALLCTTAAASDLPGVTAPAAALAISSTVPVVADLNVDGLPDIVVAGEDMNTSQSSRLQAALGVGGGLFGPASDLLLSNTDSTTVPVVADFDGDGRPDVVLAGSGWTSLRVFHGGGDGSFSQLPDAVTPGQMAPALALDANLDGDLDLAALNDIGTELRLLLGDGAGGLALAASLPNVPFGGLPRGGDFDLDGDTDLVSISSTVPSTLRLTTVGGPDLLTHLTDLSVPGQVSDVAVGQIVGTAFPDMALSLDSGSSATTVVRNLGGTSFVSIPGLPDDVGWDAIALGDVGGDGLPDLIGLSDGDDSPNTVRVRQGLPGGSFDASAVVTLGEARFLAAADVDLDGLCDALVSLNDSGRADVLLLRGQAPNRLLMHDTIPTAMGVRTLQAGDFNGDGNTDVAVLLDVTEQVGVQLGDGRGGLSAVNFTLVQPPNSPRAAAALDVDADGDTDLAVALANPTVIYRNTGAAAPVQSQLVPIPGDDLAAGDLSGDGLPDLALAAEGPGFGAGLWISINAGGGVYALPTNPYASTLIYRLGLADLDADGDLDVVAQTNSSQLDVLVHQGSSYTVAHGATTVFPTTVLVDLRTADMDEDGLTDVLVGGEFGGGVHVLSGFSASGFAQHESTDAAWAAEHVLPVDLDGDGHLDVLAADGGIALQALRGNGSGQLQPLWRTDTHNWISSVAAIDLDQDGQVELLASPSVPGVGQLTVVEQQGPAAFTSLPAGKAGAAGVPLLEGAGTLQPLTPVNLVLTHAAPLAPVTLVVGLSKLDAPFKGGLLVPAPNILIGGLASNGSGLLLMPVTWPAGLPSGLSIYLQAWITDASATHGLSASTALRALTP